MEEVVSNQTVAEDATMTTTADDTATRPPAPVVREVRDHLGVDLLMKLGAARCLAPFMRREHTLGTAATELEMPASTLAYYVKRFLRAGLLQVVRVDPRAGKPIPVYRATADEFRVPFDAMPPGRRDEFLHGSRQKVLGDFVGAMERQITTRLASGIGVTAPGTRGVAINIIDADALDDAPIAEWWGKLRLTEAQAFEFRDALHQLVERFAADEPLPGPGLRSYISMVGLVPDGKP